MNIYEKKVHHITTSKGFIAALDQSGGSTAKALSNYGLVPEGFDSEHEMMQEMHVYRQQVIASPDFNSDKIAAAILFNHTVNNTIEGKPSIEYLWKELGIPSFVKIGNGLEKEVSGVQLLSPIKGLFSILYSARKNGAVGIKARSVINRLNTYGIKKLVAQQFSIAAAALEVGIIPILEPEVSIEARGKADIETELASSITGFLSALEDPGKVILKLTLPTDPEVYQSLIHHPKVLKVVALSGGYSLEESCERLADNKGMSASFSRALLEGLRVDQTKEEFDDKLSDNINSIYKAQGG